MAKEPTEKEKQDALNQEKAQAKKKKAAEDQIQQQQNTQAAQAQAQAQIQPNWTNQQPGADMVIKGAFKIPLKEELEKAGLKVTQYEKKDKGFKFSFKDDDDKEHEIEVKGNGIFIKDHSKATFDGVAKTALAMGLKAIDISPLASTLGEKREQVLYDAYKSMKTLAPNIELKGFVDSAGKDLLEKFADKLSKETSTAPKFTANK